MKFTDGNETYIKRLLFALSIIMVIFLCIVMETQSAMITYKVFNYGDGIWEYYYWISDFIFYQDFGFTVYFVYGLCNNIIPVYNGSGWKVYAYDPQLIMGYEDPGVYDAWAQVDDASLGESFIVKFNWFGAGNPGPQRFDIYDSNLEILEEESGWTEPNLPPVADAGADQHVIPENAVALDGSLSCDPEGGEITFLWTFVEVPPGSSITDSSFSDPTSMTPSFMPDMEGIYRIALIVNDGFSDSAADMVLINGSYFETIYMDIPKGWSMISLPVVPRDAKIKALFPEARAVFEFTTRYERLSPDDELVVGTGYWIYLSEGHAYSITGTPFGRIEIDAPSGWSMIGGCSYPAKPLLENETIRAIFALSGKYGLLGSKDSLQPGKGYWVYLSEGTTIVLEKNEIP